VQDVWLADPLIPRATGAVTPESAQDLPVLATALRLTRDGTLTRTDRGRAVLCALGDATASIADGQEHPNPLRPSSAMTFLIASALLEADADFLQSAWRPMLESEGGALTRADLGRAMADVCDEFAQRMRRKVRTGRDRDTLKKAMEWGKAVREARREPRTWGGGRPPEQLCTVRCEPWVDLGLISSVDRFAYRYALAEQQRAFIAAFVDADDPVAFAESCIAGSLLACQGRKVPTPASEDEAWSAITRAYLDLRSRLGFASFKEVILLASGRLADAENPRLLELREGVDLLQARRRDGPGRVRIGINRGGQPTYVKLVDPGDR